MGGGAGPLSEETIIKLSISVAFAMRCTLAMFIAALFLLMGPASMAQSGRVVGRGTTTSFGTNPGGKYVYRGGATFGTNPGGKYVYRGGDAKFHTNPGGKTRWYGNLSQKPNRHGGRSGYSDWYEQLSACPGKWDGRGCK
jgi:hypothetical protein